MAIKRVEKEEKEAFNESAVHPLQTWEWGEFRKKTGNEIVRLGEYENDKLKTSFQIILSKIPKTKLKIGTILRGPKPTESMFKALKETAEKENAIFIKIEPNTITDIWRVDETDSFDKNSLLNKVADNLKADASDNKLLKTNTTQGKTLFTPTSFWIDLTKDEEGLMKNMHSKTRYNVRYSKRKGIEVMEDNSDEAFEKYIELTKETVERQGFYAHTEKYHRLMWETLHKEMVKDKKEPIARLLTARYKKETLTTWIVFVWKDFLYYPYGASSNKHRNRQHSSGMMWNAMLYGKSLGLKWFDLWGREEGEGFTRFKEGFNPYVVEFVGTWDLPTSPLYWPYRVAELGRWAFLRLRTKLGFVKPKF